MKWMKQAEEKILRLVEKMSFVSRVKRFPEPGD